MSKSRRALIIQTISMYVAHIPFYVVWILSQFSSVDTDILSIIFLIGLILSLIVLPICFGTLIASLSDFTKETESPLSTSIKVRLVLIPWYILNLFVGVIVIAPFLNPFLIIAIPLLLVLCFFYTLTLMAATALPSLSYTLKLLKNAKIEVTALLIVSIILHFVFVLDILGAVLLLVEVKKQLKQKN